ncbi:MAG TPA: DegT/DnrJ/EryC1/StrS family aminotransferase [Patescibacteria group bacterium]|nr:DegT/DnrJ/EryC1/StrS family aminotransferase [Patescibacteria group bacterium]
MNQDKRVRLLDLGRQLEPLRNDLERAAADVIRSGWYLFGERTNRFERAFADWLGTEHVVSCANGTDAITLALWSLGIGAGDTVLTVPNTAFPTACAITRTGATPAFVDIDPKTWLIDIEGAAGVVGESTRAVVPVHLYGHAVNIPALRDAIPGDVAIVEDCAQGHGATLNGRLVGTFSDMAAFSFYPSKNICALGDAGAVATSSGEHAGRARQLRFYGQESRDHHLAVGFNSRIDEIQAAFLTIELEHIDRWVDRRREIAGAYDAALDRNAIRRPAITGGSHPSYHLYVVRVDDRDAFRRLLDAEGIDTGIHYPVPIFYQPAYRGLGYERGDFPHAEALAGEIVSLPVAPHLSDAEVGRVIDACRIYARAGG